MSAPETKVSCKYGAPMGRHAMGVASLAGKIRMRRVRLDSGGYDQGGAYWGTGEPLWYAESDEQEAYFRAPNREAAKQLVRENACDSVRFYR